MLCLRVPRAGGHRCLPWAKLPTVQAYDTGAAERARARNFYGAPGLIIDRYLHPGYPASDCP
jgi:hypothetical protein